MNMIRENIFSFGTWVRQRRKALDLTQAAVAECTGCAEVTIRKLEAEVFRPSREIAERLADCLKIPPDERFLFLQVARGLRSADHLPVSMLPKKETSPVTAPMPTQRPPFPLDTVPQPAPLPPGSRMPLSRNSLFVGRDSHLRQLVQALYSEGTAAIGQMQLAAATGLGGIGKTQLACEFVHRYGQFFPGGVLWLSFADPAAIPAEVAACGGVDGMHLSPEFGRLPLDEQVRRVLVAWQQPSPRLLVFDNCEDEALLDQWHPKHGGCCVLITSRRRQWTPAMGVQMVPLDVLPRSDSLALLHRFRPDLPAQDADLHAIAEVLGDLPLALHLAGSFLAKYRHAITLTQYRQRLQAPTILHDRSLHTAGLSPTKHVQHVARTFEQSYERLDPTNTTDALALAFLARAACFAPGESIPRWLLLQTIALDDHPDDPLLAEDALTRLIDLGLVEPNGEDAFRIHRLLIAFVRTVIVDVAAQAAVELMMLRVVDSLNRTRNPLPLLTVQSHFRFITDRAQPRNDAQSAGLSWALGYYLWLGGTYTEARHYLEQALAIQEQVLGRGHPDTARSLCTLGEVLVEQGDLAVARRCLEQSVEIYAQLLGGEHPGTARGLNVLGALLWARGELEAARRCLEQSWSILDQGVEPLDKVYNLNFMGLVLRAQGDLAAARGFYEEALLILGQGGEAEHPYTAWSLNCLGSVLHAQGDLVAARSYLERALAIREKIFGLDHPETAWSLNSLGSVLHAQGDLVVARSYLERALAIREKIFGLDHSSTRESLKGLTLILHVQGDLVAAQSHLERDLATPNQRLGATLADIPIGFTTLATLNTSQEQLIALR